MDIVVVIEVVSQLVDPHCTRADVVSYLTVAKQADGVIKLSYINGISTMATPGAPPPSRDLCWLRSCGIHYKRHLQLMQSTARILPVLYNSRQPYSIVEQCYIHHTVQTIPAGHTGDPSCITSPKVTVGTLFMMHWKSGIGEAARWSQAHSPHGYAGVVLAFDPTLIALY